MEFCVYRASDWDEGKKIRIDTLEDLERIYKDYGKYELIIDFDGKGIMIYNEYIE